MILISGFVLIVIALGNEEREPGLILYPGLILMVIGMIFSLILTGATLW